MLKNLFSMENGYKKYCITYSKILSFRIKRFFNIKYGTFVSFWLGANFEFFLIFRLFIIS